MTKRLNIDDGFYIRPISPNDCGQVSRLHLDLDSFGWNQNQWQQAIVEYPTAWLVVQDENIYAYIIYQAKVEQVELLNIGVDRRFQGKGLASNLIKTTRALLPRQTESIFLEVRRSNVPAINLYKNLDFIKVGERPNYYSVTGGTREDALIFKYKF